MDVTDYKHVVLGLFFLKYLADAFEECRVMLRREMETDPITRERSIELLGSPDWYAAKGVSWLPPEARWDYLRERASRPNIGEMIDGAIDLIELGNPSLRGILPKIYARIGLDPQRFGEVIDLISGIGSGTVEPARRTLTVVFMSISLPSLLLRKARGAENSILPHQSHGCLWR